MAQNEDACNGLDVKLNRTSSVPKSVLRYELVVYNCFFCGKSSGKNALTWRQFACSLKRYDVGYCGKLSGMRGALLAEREGGNKKL